MPDENIAPLSPRPDLWSLVEMWGLVNQIVAARSDGLWPDDLAKTVVLAAGECRPVKLVFSRPALQVEKGWSWDHHYHDEQVTINFQEDGVYIHACVGAGHIIIARMIVVFAICSMFVARNNVIGVSILCSLSDSDGNSDILSFSSCSQRDFLIPDPYFMLTRGYEEERRYIDQNWLDMDRRDPRFYWRGAPSGMGKYNDQFDSQRVKLVQFANDPRRRANFNVRFANAHGLSDPVREALEKLDGFSAPEDQMEISKYAFNVDVDGVSSSWTGFFLKLLVGVPVLKIESDMGYRQWYYDELVAGEHYAIVASDMRDFSIVTSSLIKNKALAMSIGEAGRKFALSLDLKTQIEAATNTIERAISSPRCMKIE